MTRVILTLGVGGAGKTTTSAAIGVAEARKGNRVVVVTIDPARRLADALGLKALGNDPQRIPLDDAAGRLDALMLDRRATFDEMVTHAASSPDAARRLMANPYYDAVSQRLSGGQEMMATEKLYQLVRSGDWDVVVVDTPPSQHAVDFFRAPARLERILDQSLLGPLLRPGRGLIGMATKQVTSLIRRLAGAQVIDDLAEFFSLLGGVSDGLKAHSRKVHDLLSSDRTSYYLVTNAHAPREHDLFAFLARLGEQGISLSAILINRLRAAPAWAPAEEAGLREADDPILRGIGDLAANYRSMARHDQVLVQRLHQQLGDIPSYALPDLTESVADLDGLRQLSEFLPPLSGPHWELPD